ncbi:complexin-3-like [Pseudoliparis swirei]|uniref:complexin-3-like n=1 Tax=Pseudoliparis swirei TaxID=2059687 RepID=UPI0024BDE1C1|nr:complexin-3-like [Pseudoliparis swirei]XP_056300637.1 complexin-3-like [Pseudoliparis swirei]
MESVVRGKKLLKRPIRKLTSWVSRAKGRTLLTKHRNKRGRGRRGRGGGKRSEKTPSLRASPPREPSIICSYLGDLEKERNLREAMNAQKNAERAAVRGHFRRKYQLSESPKDAHHLKSVGGKVSLPRKLSKIIHPETKTKDDGFNLLSAFQGLSFGTGELKGRNRSKTSTPASATCKVM